MAVRVRFAPSPTGHLHLGGLRTALFNYFFARSQKGKFILRIEDTDQSRLVPGAVDGLIRDLEWAGIHADEGPHIEGGLHGPYIQSQRTTLYRDHAEDLLASGHAYRCFCSTERLGALRSLASRTGQSTSYDKHCRHLSSTEMQNKAASGDPYTIRLKVPSSPEATTIHDLVYGSTTFMHEFIDDQVLMKSDGFPTYHLANVVDDHDMKITHVLRGEEWRASTPKHILLYQAFGWEPPQFAHLPLLINPDRTKLSKRAGAMFVSQLREQGFTPQMLCNFVALLGWTLPETMVEVDPKPTAIANALQDVFADLDSVVAAFDLSQVHVNPAVVNMDKLGFLAKRHLRMMHPGDAEYVAALEQLNALLENQPWFGDLPIKPTPTEMQAAFNLAKDTYDSLQSISANLAFFWQNPPTDSIQCGGDRDVILTRVNVLKHVQKLMHQDVSTPLTAQQLQTFLKDVCKSLNIKPKVGMIAMRLALTGSQSGPSIAKVAEVLGRDTVLTRVQAAIEGAQ
eukprot:m.17948 g.17948  ORF g.17948 m.17948 type:complete len:511 (+) comp7621_c0_seq1:83-1615(+)